MSTQRKTETIPEWKQIEVDDVVDFLEDHDSVGVVDITGIPSRQLQQMRNGLHGTAALRVSRNTLLERALDEVDEGLEQLTEYVSGQVGLVGTNENPFGLYQELEASKTSAPINAGEVTPNDIVIPEGDTGVDPGPFVGELQTVGANARIDEGSIKVMEDSTVLEEGKEVSADLANVLGELDIEPKEVGLDLRAVFADGVLFEPADLELDVEAFRSDIETGVARSRNLALNAEFPTARTMPSLIAKGTGEAKSLALQAGIENPEVMPDLIGQADGQVRALATTIDDPEALPDELQGVATSEESSEQAPEDDESADEQTDESVDEQADESAEQPDDQTDADTPEDASDDAETEDDDGDDDEDGGDALGEMFG